MDKDDEALPVDEYNLLNVSHVVGISSHEIHYQTSQNKGYSSSGNVLTTSLIDNDIVVKSEANDWELQQNSNCNSNLFELETFGSLIKDEDEDNSTNINIIPNNEITPRGNAGNEIDHCTITNDIDIEETKLLNEIKLEPDPLEQTLTNVSSISTRVDQVTHHQSNTTQNNTNTSSDNRNISVKSKEKKTNIKLPKVCKKKNTTTNNYFDNINSLDPEIPLELIGCLTKRSVHLKQSTALEERNKQALNINSKTQTTNDTEKINRQKTIESYTDIINNCISQMSSDGMLNSILAPLKYSNMHDDKSKIFTPEPNKVCKQCGHSYHQVSALIEHLIQFHPSVFVCDVCGVHFDLKSSIRNHMNIHFKNTQYACGDCDFTSFRRSTFYTHRKQHVDCNVYKCEYCKFTAEYYSQVKYHQRCHFTQNRLQCPKCSYKTPYPGILKRHMISHNIERPYKCDVCPFTCKYKYGLLMHKRTHSEDASYVCTVCQRAFKWSCALAAHMITHSNEKKYFCNECSYSTARSMCMQRHQIKHLNSLQCTDCSYTTGKLKVLICHRIRKHKVNNLYSCPFCDFTSKNARKTIEHKSIHLKSSNRKNRQTNNQI